MPPVEYLPNTCKEESNRLVDTYFWDRVRIMSRSIGGNVREEFLRQVAANLPSSAFVKAASRFWRQGMVPFSDGLLIDLVGKDLRSPGDFTFL